ncbi:hypothetical protein BX666DRAFT_2033811 [Dichotomocladium elegans]|nr:hypothetical protein BX666DRAFT_2033811 [Dichotomocladium elegans]
MVVTVHMSVEDVNKLGLLNMSATNLRYPVGLVVRGISSGVWRQTGEAIELYEKIITAHESEVVSGGDVLEVVMVQVDEYYGWTRGEWPVQLLWSAEVEAKFLVSVGWAVELWAVVYSVGNLMEAQVASDFAGPVAAGFVLRCVEMWTLIMVKEVLDVVARKLEAAEYYGV